MPSEVPQEKEHFSPIHFSPETLAASGQVNTHIAQGSPVSRETVSTLLDTTQKDLARDGVSLTPEERAQWEKEVTAIVGSAPAEETKRENTHLNFADYRDMFNHVYDTYGLEKVGKKLMLLEAPIVAETIIRGLGIAGTSRLATEPGALARLVGALGRLHRGQLVAGDQRTLLVEGFGAVSAVAILPSIILAGAARRQFEKEMLHVRRSINERVASSIFMRDFEYIHDKSPAELLNILNAGKQATLNLVKLTYLDLIPNLAGLGGAIALQAESLPMVGLSLLRLPVLVRSIQTLTKEVLRERRADLARKDLIDGRILSTLQSLEIVKTSDSLEQAIHDLEKNMEASDELQRLGQERQIARQTRTDVLSTLFTTGTPFVGAGWSLLRGIMRIPNFLNRLSTLPRGTQIPDDLLAPLTGAMRSYGLGTYGQRMLERYARTIALLYAEHIQPAIQDIRRMEDLLGPYNELDKPNGPKELVRKPVDELPNFDIQVNNLTFKHILHGVSLDIPQGAFLTIKGISGIGKTTFLRHLVGLYAAPAGSITYGGVDLQSIKKFGEHSIYSKLAYANQNPQYFDEMSLKDNLLLWTQRDVSNEQITRVLRDLHLDHLTGRLDQKTKHYSGGELRRIGIARALLKDPRVLFLDEPTANLDESSARQVLDVIRELRSRRPEMTVVAVTHDPNFEEIAERIVDFGEINKKPIEQMFVRSSAS